MVPGKKTIPNPGRAYGDGGEPGPYAECKKKASENGRPKGSQAVHGPLVWYREIACISYDQKGMMEIDVGEVHLDGGDNLGGEQTEQKRPGCVGKSTHRYIANPVFRAGSRFTGFTPGVAPWLWSNGVLDCCNMRES